MNRWKKIFEDSRENRSRSRPLEVGRFKPQTREEYLTHEIAKSIGEKNMAYLKSILDRYGYSVIEESWNELREAKNVKSHTRLLNHLIQQRINNGPDKIDGSGS